MSNNTGKTTRAAQGYSAKFWNALRGHLSNIGYAKVESATGIKRNTVASFCLGRSKGLTEESMAALQKANLIPQEIEALTQSTVNVPMESWTGEVATVADVAREKGYSPATIRNYCKNGKLDYVKKGRNVLVCKNDRLANLPETKLAFLRKRVADLEKENEQLKKQVETMQLEFAFEGPATEQDSDTNLPALVEDVQADPNDDLFLEGIMKKADAVIIYERDKL